MSRLNWINPKDYTFDHMLLLDRFQIRMMLGIPMADSVSYTHLTLPTKA